MLPPLHTHPGASQKSGQQPATQPWVASTSGSTKAPGVQGFGSGGPGNVGGSIANCTRPADTGASAAGNATSGRAPGTQGASPARLTGSAGSNRVGRTRNSGGEASSRNDPLKDAQRLAQPQTPRQGSHQLQQQQQQGQAQHPLQAQPYLKEAPGAILDQQNHDLDGQPEQELQELPYEGDQLLQQHTDREELGLLEEDQQQQTQQQQNMLLNSSNPYLQILRQAGVAVGNGYADGLAAAAQAAHEVQQAALRKRVQRDIKRMLAGNRAYQHHVKGPPALSAESLAQLAQPKQRPGSRPDPQVAANLPDPVEWARWKTDQLVISRLAEERKQVELAEEKRRAEEQLTVFRHQKMEAKQAKAEAKARQAAEEAAYRANMSAFLNHKGALDLEDFVNRKEEQRERLSLMRSRQVKTLSAHHY